MSAAATSAALSQITVAETDKPTPKPGLLTAAQAAKALGIAMNTVRQWGRDGRMYREAIPGGRFLYDAANAPKVRQATQRALALAKQERAVRCRVVSVARHRDDNPEMVWPNRLDEPPLGEGAWAEWLIVRDALPAITCTPAIRRGAWSLVGQCLPSPAPPHASGCHVLARSIEPSQ
jgi:hypothetical protein